MAEENVNPIPEEADDVVEIIVRRRDGSEEVITKGAAVSYELLDDQYANVLIHACSMSGEDIVNMIGGMTQLIAPHDEDLERELANIAGEAMYADGKE